MKDANLVLSSAPEFQRVEAMVFRDAVNHVKLVSPRVAANLSYRTLWTYRHGRCFLSQDRNTGVAITEFRELISLFNIGSPGRGKLAVEFAIDSGATSLECSPQLIEYYGSFGFRVESVTMTLSG
jgi:hypothetical protein